MSEQQEQQQQQEQKKEVQFVPGSKVVILQYEDLVAEKDLTASIEQAFGKDGYGLLVVRGVPGFSELRQGLLPLAHKFANLPDEVKNKVVHKESAFSFGWSHGNESYNGVVDFAKGSYYNNPIYNRPFDDEEIIKKWATFAHPNIWPDEDLPELEPAFMKLGKLVVDVGVLLAKQCDRYVEAHSDKYEKGRLERVISTSRTVKARLLHYFPVDNVEEQKEVGEGSWCGWHNDHSSLTGLVPGMFITQDGKQIKCPDDKAGLYAKARTGELAHIKIPEDCLGFQLGEAEQIHSGGLLQATPHCVKAARNAKGVSRESFAVFMEPMWEELMEVPEDRKPEDATYGSSAKFLPKGVPPLEERWENKDDYGKFTETTVKKYTVY